MNLTDELKNKIDSMSYYDLLHQWRFAPSGNEMFQGESGEYYSNRMKELRNSGADHVGASKKMGFERA